MPVRAENDGEAAGHVFAAVIADAFDDGECAGVAHRKPLACAACGEQPAAGSAVESDVAEQRVWALSLQRDATAPRRSQFPAAEALADEVVGETFELRVMPATAKAPKDWPAMPCKLKVRLEPVALGLSVRYCAICPARRAPRVRSSLVMRVSREYGRPAL